ncbi:MAG: glycosyltransferase, partial [Desulfobacteraceae bacterium]|nr:glycosyltransferase [Desulfobacteraceae bacterium]
RFCFDRAARRQIRKECDFGDNEKVICYSGGLSRWQRVADILSLCCQISKMRENFKFLFLTQQVNQLRRMILGKKLAAERCVIRSCMPQEVPQYLSAADAGIILRDDIAVNNVASPIKIGEYLGCGLPVILTRGIGDYSEMIGEAGVGVVLDDSGDVARQIIGFMEKPEFGKLRYKAIVFAQENISWDSHLEDLKRLFSPDR